MRSAPAASPRRPSSVSPTSGAGEVLEGSAASARHNTAGSAAFSTVCPGQDGAPGGPYASTSGRAATKAPQLVEGRRTSPRPDPWLQHQPQLRAQHERGRLSRGVSESISVSGRGARAAALPERSGSETGAAPALPLPGVTSSGARLYLQLLREAAGAGSRASRPISQRRQQKPEEVRRKVPRARGGASQLRRREQRGGVPTAAFPNSSSAVPS